VPAWWADRRRKRLAAKTGAAWNIAIGKAGQPVVSVPIVLRNQHLQQPHLQQPHPQAHHQRTRAAPTGAIKITASGWETTAAACPVRSVPFVLSHQHLHQPHPHPHQHQLRHRLLGPHAMHVISVSRITLAIKQCGTSQGPTHSSPLIPVLSQIQMRRVEIRRTASKIRVRSITSGRRSNRLQRSVLHRR